MNRNYFEKILDGLAAKGKWGLAHTISQAARQAKEGRDDYYKQDDQMVQCVTDMAAHLTMEELDYFCARYWS